MIGWILATAAAVGSFIAYNRLEPTVEPTAAQNKYEFAIVIGDSQSPYVVAHSEYFKAVLWGGGQGIDWLIKALRERSIDRRVGRVAICIGVNDRYPLADPRIPILTNLLKEKFPDAFLFVVQGSWGWGGVSPFTEERVREYYRQFSDNGIKVLEPPIGYGDPHGDKASYKAIGATLDSLFSERLPVTQKGIKPVSNSGITFPAEAGAARENLILQGVKAGDSEYTFSRIISSVGELTAEFKVFSDALIYSGVRVNVNAITNQRIADLLDCMPLTSKLVDLMWQQRTTTILPKPSGQDDARNRTTAEMIAHSVRIDAFLAKQPEPHGLIDTVGKLWILDNKLLASPGMAANYGWPFNGASYQGIVGEKSSTGNWRVIQGIGTRHDVNFTDYSQVCRLVSMNCTVNGVPMRMDQVLSDPKMAMLANRDGVLKVLRQPGA